MRIDNFVFIVPDVAVVVLFFRKENDSDLVAASCWEISSKVIILQSILGCGTFGEVWKAVVGGLSEISEETVVAVKKLKRKATSKSIKMFFLPKKNG